MRYVQRKLQKELNFRSLQHNHKRAPFPKLALSPNCPAVPLDYPFADRKPQPAAADLARQSAIDLMELIEYLVQFFYSNTFAKLFVDITQLLAFRTLTHTL